MEVIADIEPGVCVGKSAQQPSIVIIGSTESFKLTVDAFNRLGQAFKQAQFEVRVTRNESFDKALAKLLNSPAKVDHKARNQQPFWTRDWRKGGRR